MGRQLTNNLTAEQKEEILKHPGGKERVLKLNENVVKQLTDSISNIKSEIKGVESMAISWISLTIVLTIFQILPLRTTEVRGFIFSCLPSFVILIYATAFTLLKSPTNSKPDFAVVEEKDIDMRLKISEAEIQALTYINLMLHKNYDRKMFFKKYIAPSVIVNFTVSIIFIIIKTFFSSLMTDTLWIILGGLSIISILFLQWKLSFNKTLTTNFPLNA